MPSAVRPRGRHEIVPEKEGIDAWPMRGRILLYAVITVALAGILFAIGLLKSGYHVDEILTFVLSNHQGSESTASAAVDIDEAVVYQGSEIWDIYTSIPEGGSFDYANVWQNQSNDVHPPSTTS